jgi:predicted transcriptional regulator
MEDVRLEMLKMWKASWETYTNSLTMMQVQGTKMLDLLFNQSETAQDETQRLIREGLEKAKDAQKSYFQAVEDNFKKIEELLNKK